MLTGFEYRHHRRPGCDLLRQQLDADRVLEASALDSGEPLEFDASHLAVPLVAIDQLDQFEAGGGQGAAIPVG